MSTSIDRDDSKRLMVFAGRSSQDLGQRIAQRSDRHGGGSEDGHGADEGGEATD